MRVADTVGRAPPSRLAQALNGVLAGVGAVVTVGALLADVISPSGMAGLGLLQVMAVLGGVTLAAQAVPAWVSDTPLLVHLESVLRTASLEGAVRFGLIAVQVVLFAVAVRRFQIESPAFYSALIPLAVFGFFVHHFLPVPQRLPFFVALSLSGVVLVLGVVQGLWLIGLVVSVITLCHVRAPFAIRAAALVAAGVILGFMRAGLVPFPWSPAVWPIVGSMLMFRVVIYLYDLKHASSPPPVSWTLSYFFMLPNVVFPFFPVVDFSTFRRTYFDRDAIDIYQRGVHWMVRGVIHLLLYRVVYQYLTIAPEDVNTTAELLRYVLATFLLYLKVSGLFHLIVGMLHLYGFRLPETHHLFYLASTFTDIWRRINIYWKDFMTKVVFYPIFLPMRRYGERTALVTATAAVFFITWLTHSYQWFWILGVWKLSWPDLLFWVVLGAFLVADSLRELRHGRMRSIGKPVWSARHALRLGLSAAATFAAMAFLWSFWNSPTVGDWLDLVAVARPTLEELGMIFGVLATIGVLAVLTNRYRGLMDVTEWAKKARGRFAWRSAAVPLTGLTAACLIASPTFEPVLGASSAEFLRDLRVPELNEQDARRMERGYYEDLLNVSAQNNALFEVYAQRPNARADIWSSGVLDETDTFMARELRPFVSVYQRGVSFRTNRWGMRDRDYAQIPEEGTYRIALLGQSYVAGDGVSDGETFETIVEDRLNAEQTGAGAARFEILNFAVGSYSVFQQLMLLDRVFTFEPDAVYFVATPTDANRAVLHLVQQIRRGVDPPFPHVQEIVEATGVNATTRETEAIRRLQPYGDDLVAWALREMASTIQSHGATGVWVYLYVPQDDGFTPADVSELVGVARAAGLVPVDLFDVYAGRDLAELRVSESDRHPSAEGHRVIADRFYNELVTNRELGVPVRASQTTSQEERR